MKRLVAGMAAAMAAAMAVAGPLEDLAGRVSPELAGRVRFRVDPGAKAITVAPSGKDGIAIVAPGTRLAAAGLGLYLREVANAHWSWCGSRLEGPWPTPSRTLTFVPAYPHTQAYNYCTLSYTMAFWDEAAWREELDRLALFGVEMPLVQAGLQKVWQLTLREVGYPEARIAAFLPDEAAAAWWNMGNLEGLGGPLPQEAIDRNAEVGRFIVQEAKALGMKPILQAFTGLVPHDLGQYLDKTRFPDARFVGQGTWCEPYFVRPAVLDPTTRAFRELAAIWYRNLFAVYQSLRGLRHHARGLLRGRPLPRGRAHRRAGRDGLRAGRPGGAAGRLARRGLGRPGLAGQPAPRAPGRHGSRAHAGRGPGARPAPRP